MLYHIYIVAHSSSGIKSSGEPCLSCDVSGFAFLLSSGHLDLVPPAAGTVRRLICKILSAIESRPSLVPGLGPQPVV